MKISNDVLVVLGQAECDGNALILTGQLDKKLYAKVNEVLEAAGGKWSCKAKAHLFGADAGEIIGDILLTGEIVTHKDFDYFPTCRQKQSSGETEITEGLGSHIEVPFKITKDKNLDEALPRLADGDYIFVQNISGKWYCVTVFQGSKNCGWKK